MSGREATELNIPNIITLGRIILVPVIVWAIASRQMEIAFAIFVIAGDAQLQPYFAVLLAEVGSRDLTGFAALSESLTEFFAVACGAQNFTYNGMNMVDAHNSNNPRMTGLVNDADFNRFVADLVEGAAQNDVPADIVTDIGELVETLREPIVQE